MKNVLQLQILILVIYAATCLLLTHRGLIHLRKLKLKSTLSLSICSWFLFVAELFSAMNYHFYGLVTAFLGCGAAIFSLTITLKERERESSLRQLLKQIPLKDRILGRYPKEFFEKMPLPTPPKTSSLAMLGIVLLIESGIANLTLNIMGIYMLSLLEEAPGAVFSLNIIPGVLLLFGAILIYKKRYSAGGLIGIIFGALTIISTFPSLIFGWIIGLMGIVGGVLSILQEKAQLYN